MALNVDGIERKRRKWNAAGRLWYLISERLATWLPNVVVTDARVMQHYYLDRYGCPSAFIPYGCTAEGVTTRRALDGFGL